VFRPPTITASCSEAFKDLSRGLPVCHSLTGGVPQLGPRGRPDFTEAEVEGDVFFFAAQYKIQGRPNDQGEMFERRAAADHLQPPFPNEQRRLRHNGRPAAGHVGAPDKASQYEPGFPWFLVDIGVPSQELASTTCRRAEGLRAQAADPDDEVGQQYNVYFRGLRSGMAAALSDGPS